MRIHADFDKAVAVDTEAMSWVPSPMAGVDRRMLDRIGDEVARATSIVRYAPESYFSPHTHSGGEEFIVLEGTFVDEHGDYPAGSYVRNPVGSSHTPSSPDGCVIFVKLWQMEPNDQEFVRLSLTDLDWVSSHESEIETASLYEFGNETVSCLRVRQDGGSDQLIADGGAEFLVLNGRASVNGELLPRHAWLRLPSGTAYTISGAKDTLIWRKTGHLTNIKVPG